MKSYSVKELAVLAGVTPRTLRHYDQIGLLSPERQGSGDYRMYTTEEVDRLQEILLFRELGMELSVIRDILDAPETSRRHRLAQHLDSLRSRQAQLDILIKNVEDTIKAEKGEIEMNDDKKFEGLKKDMINENEKKYGSEIRETWGDEAVDESNRKMMNLSKEDFEDLKKMAAEINERLADAVTRGLDPAGEEGQEIAKLHKKWLGYSWPSYSVEAHIGLTEMYIADERFRKYYDDKVDGCAEFLRDAVAAMAKL